MYSIFLGGVNADSPESPGNSLSFSTRLKNLGFLSVTNPLEAQFAICVDNEKDFQMNINRARISKERSIIVRNEPVVVCPENKLSRTGRRYGLSLDMGRPPSKSENSIPWPQQWPTKMINFETNSSRHERIALVNGNKISFIPGELYSLRREAIMTIKSLDLYGTSWDLSSESKIRHALSNLVIAIKGGYFPRISGARYYFKRFPSWKGSPFDKRRVLFNYKYCLVIENSTEFMTEKLFDAFFSGCIPIYVGPELEEFPIPANLYFQAKPNLKSIKESLTEASKIDYKAWHIELCKWLNLDSTKKYWSADEVNTRVIKAINKYCNKII
jgi:hypothetical protein